VIHAYLPNHPRLIGIALVFGISEGIKHFFGWSANNIVEKGLHTHESNVHLVSVSKEHKNFALRRSSCRRSQAVLLKSRRQFHDVRQASSAWVSLFATATKNLFGILILLMSATQ
jgi:hypothetical protein